MDQIAAEKLRHLLAKFEGLEDCSVLTPAGQPVVREGHVLPSDLAAFYALAGGAILFENSEFPAAIVPAERLLEANPIIVGQQIEEDISASWYTIVDDMGGNYLTIDLDPTRLGRCYDSFWDRHGVRGSCPIIATSFTDLLSRLIRNEGEHWYWLEPDFESLGDAYDALPAFSE
jgi:antitoxin YokJ